MPTLQHHPSPRNNALARVIISNRSRNTPVASTLIKAPVYPAAPMIFIVSDNRLLQDAIRQVLEFDGNTVSCFVDGTSFLDTYQPGQTACVLIDALLPGTGGIALIAHLKRVGIDVPSIMISHTPTHRMAVLAMRAGAFDVIEAPAGPDVILPAVKSALEHASTKTLLHDHRLVAKRQISSLTSRQREILQLVLAGHPSKNIAADLRISQRTVDNHRAAIARKTGTKTLSALIRTALRGGCKPLDAVTEPAPQPHQLIKDNGLH